MNTKLESLRMFLEDAHKNGTNCGVAEKKLTEALTLLPCTKNEEEKMTLKVIIGELEQVRKLCALPRHIVDDDVLCGV